VAQGAKDDLTSQKTVVDGIAAAESDAKGKPARLTLRNGVWYADGVPCRRFGKALRATLQAAGLAGAFQRPPGRGKCRLRLEERLWWPEFLAERAARIAAERAVRERSDAALRAAIRRAGGPEAVQKVSDSETFAPADLPEKVSDSETFAPPKSLTLRERFFAKAACA
jgi:hypothetical protein